MLTCLRYFFFFASSLIFCRVSLAQPNKIQQEVLRLQHVLETNHYSPRQLDDSLSREIFLQYLDYLDPHHLYFTAADYRNFKDFALTLDDELAGKGWKFFPLVADIYKQRLAVAVTVCETLTAKPFNFTTGEKLAFTASKTNYAADQPALTQRWAKWLKFQTLWQLVNSFDNEAAAKPTEKQLLTKEPEIRNKVRQIETRKIKKILEHPQGYEHFLKMAYFNAITASFDPHTNYLSKSDLQNFQSQLSVEGFSFGFDLDENELGDVEIARLVPGGPAWKSNELHKGDVLLKLQWLNKQPYDLTGADLPEINLILEASNSEVLEVTVRSAGGIIKKVPLKKEKLRADENIVKSFIVRGDKKVGYISLPGFYTEWDQNSAQGCANDVAKEIIKLSKEGIDGLILDVRYNGGGSLEEGLNLAGIFIDEGPLLLIQDKDRKTQIIRDANRGTVYDGPLLLLVNGQSASASELLAATLQDYNRALIVGSTTFGKATAQVILPLDPNVKNLDNPKSPYGFANTTMNKIFRVTGKTAQLTGVQPDVALPDVYDLFEEQEAAMPHALATETVTKKAVYTKLPALPVTSLQEKSKARLLKNEGFKSIEALRAKPDFEPFEKHQEIPLTTAFFQAIKQEQANWYQVLKSVGSQPVKTYRVENPPFNQELLAVDTYGKEINDTIIKDLQSDIYLEESYYILLDLINGTK